MVYILATILIFGIMIAVHELGHFLVARACGVTVYEFSIGMGPMLYHREKNGTLYTLRLLPIGGYCALQGEDEECDDPHGINNQAIWKRLLVFAAGSLMNFLCGVVILFFLYSSAEAFRTPEVVDFQDNCPYQSEQALQVGDVFHSINGHRIYLFTNVSEYLARGDGEGFDLVVIRNGEKVDLGYVPMVHHDYPQEDGSVVRGYGFMIGGVVEATLGQKLKISWYTAIDFMRMIWKTLTDLVSGQVGIDQFSGPVGVASAVTQMGQASATVGDAIANIAYLAALIMVNLAVINLLPLPALDGGKILFLLVNGASMLVLRRTIPQKYENYIHAIGFALLMMLTVFVLFQDIGRLLG